MLLHSYELGTEENGRIEIVSTSMSGEGMVANALVLRGEKTGDDYWEKVDERSYNHGLGMKDAKELVDALNAAGVDTPKKIDEIKRLRSKSLYYWWIHYNNTHVQVHETKLDERAYRGADGNWMLAKYHDHMDDGIPIYTQQTPEWLPELFRSPEQQKQRLEKIDNLPMVQQYVSRFGDSKMIRAYKTGSYRADIELIDINSGDVIASCEHSDETIEGKDYYTVVRDFLKDHGVSLAFSDINIRFAAMVKAMMCNLDPYREPEVEVWRKNLISEGDVYALMVVKSNVVLSLSIIVGSNPPITRNYIEGYSVDGEAAEYSLKAENWYRADES